MHDVTQVELSRRLGITKAAMNRIANGRAHPSPQRAEEIAALFGVTVSELFAPASVCVLAGARVLDSAPIYSAAARR